MRLRLPFLTSSWFFTVLSCACLLLSDCVSEAFSIVPPRYSSTQGLPQRFHTSSTSLYDTKIPKQLRAEIYRAEANTPAAQGRRERTIAYGVSAIVLVLLGAGNAVLTSTKNAGIDLEEVGYGWTQSNPLLSNVFGGYFDVLAAGIFGTMVELENKTRDDTAQQIWEELQRRKASGEKSPKKRGAVSKSKGGKKPSSRKKKRLAALAEVVLEEDTSSATVSDNATTSTTDINEDEKKKGGDGIMGKLKDFYAQADSMAASQALLLNKDLEEKGILDKITDETGLKVIGKEAASKLEEEKKDKTNK